MKYRTYYGRASSRTVDVKKEDKKSVPKVSNIDSFEQSYKDFISNLKKDIEEKEIQKVDDEKDSQ